ARLPDRVYLRRDTAPAIPRGVPPRTLSGAEHRLGRPAERGRRSAVVSPVSEGNDRPPGPAALDRTAAELELELCGAPLDQPRAKRSPHRGSLRHHVV